MRGAPEHNSYSSQRRRWYRLGTSASTKQALRLKAGWLLGQKLMGETSSPPCNSQTLKKIRWKVKIPALSRHRERMRRSAAQTDSRALRRPRLEPLFGVKLGELHVFGLRQD